VGPADPTAQTPICVLLLPVPLERFAERERAEDLMRAQGVVGVDPARLPYTAFGRLPEPFGDGLAARQARRLVRTLRRRKGTPRVVVIFHALQYQLARAVVAAVPACELWYWRTAGEEAAADDAPTVRERRRRLDERAADRAAWTAGPVPDRDTIRDRLLDLGIDVRV
jgi:hypothetical protein